MGGQVGMGGMGPQMGQQFGDQGAPIWSGNLAQMGGEPRQNLAQIMGQQMGGVPQQPQGMISSGAFYRHLNQPPGQRGVISGQQPMGQQLAQMAGQALSGYQNMGGMGEPLSNAMARFNQGQAGGQQGQMGMLSGMTGGCPPWMPGCQGGGGGYGGGFAGSMPMYGGSRPTLQAQLPAAPRPAPPPSSTSLNDGSWMR